MATHLPPPQVDYRQFRLGKINQPEYKHLWLLLFWPIFGLRYLLIENFNPATEYHLIHCPLDDLIPFQEAFLIPYVLWYLCIFGMHLYTALYDIDSFRQYSKFLIISMSISTTIFLVYPSYQTLRPNELPRDNVLTRIVQLLYGFDTSTNVFPTEHAIGSLAVLSASLHTKELHSPLKTALIATLMITICLSTVFLKQHSVLDVLMAVLVSAVTYRIVYKKHPQKKDKWRKKYE